MVGGGYTEKLSVPTRLVVYISIVSHSIAAILWCQHLIDTWPCRDASGSNQSPRGGECGGQVRLPINPDAICALASSFNHGEPCRLFTEMKKGSFNLRYFVIFNSDEKSMNGDRWVVRIPNIPRLGFPMEKMRAEIATMKQVLVARFIK